VSEKRTVVLRELTKKTGTSKKTGKAWTRWGFRDANGETYGTFDHSVIEAAEGKEGQRFNIEIEQDGTFVNLLALEPATQSQNGDEPDWELIGLRKTRCALWAGLLDGLAPSLYAANKGEVGRLLEQSVILVAAAEKDIFEREPGDDGIPFEGPEPD
jgi:hypothetical protein